jgi:putative redox protein
VPDRPPVTAELVWSEALRFGATVGGNAVVIDGDSIAGLSPPQMLAVSLASCMAIDLVFILQKGRHPLASLRVSLVAERAADQPRRFLRVSMHFHVTGAVPAEAVDRALTLSREKYCSVWQSLRQDIELTTSFEVHQ